MTAGIARLLHADAEIRNESFADSRDADDHYDLAIGNVPFGNMALHDRRHNPAGHSIHNHFIVKALRLVRPGGLMVVLTSRFTMDARNPLVTSYYDWSSTTRTGGSRILPIISEAALRATLGILARTVARGYVGDRT